MGLAIYGITALQYASGRKTVAFFLGFIGFLLALQTILGTVAAFVTAKITGASFGELWTAMLKLAGIIVFTGALSLAIPYGGLLVVFIYLGLLMWLLDLAFGEAVIFAIVFTLIRFAVVLTFYYGFDL